MPDQLMPQALLKLWEALIGFGLITLTVIFVVIVRWLQNLGGREKL